MRYKRSVRGSARRVFKDAALVGCIAVVAAAPLQAQGRRDHEQALLGKLPTDAQTVLKRLDALNELKADQWRYHEGDVAHGEATDLDDSSWKQVGPKTEVPAGAAWFRHTVEIPKTMDGYDPTGVKIMFRFYVRSESDVPEIVYLNGRRVALGSDLEPVELTADAKPGDKFLIAVKLLATGDKKTFQGARLHVEFAPNRPNPDDFVQEVLGAEALIPVLSKNAKADQATLEKAVSMVDVKALDGSPDAGQQKFDASLKSATQQLDSLKPMLQQVTFHETGNSHIDAAWLWPRSEAIDVVRRTFGTAAQLLQEYPKYTYTQSAAQYNEWVADKYPELNDEIKKDIKAGRWEVVGGMWVEPDLNIPGDESTVRSILLGKRWYQKHYGVDVTIGWNPDTFGYNWQMPQIYKKSGFTTFVTQKMSWNDTNQLPLKLFWWESPDGSKILTYFPHGYGNQTIEPTRLSTDFATARKDAPGLPSMMDLYGVGDHGGGPTRAMLDQGMRWADGDKATGKFEFGTALSYFKSVEDKIAPDSKTWDYKSIGQGYTYPTAPPDGKISIPTWKSELYLEFHRGTYTTQAEQKYHLRHSQIEALNAEKFASLAWLDGSTYPNPILTDAWEKITFNGFHDLAAGSGIAVIYRDANKDFATVKRETNEVSQAATKTVNARINTSGGDGVPVLVWNTLGWQRTGPVKISVQMPDAAKEVSVVDGKGNVLPSHILDSNDQTHSFTLEVQAKDVPPMGYTLLHVVAGKKDFQSDLKSHDLTLENTNLRVTVDPKNGCITSLFDKKDSFETIAKGGCGNQLQAFVNKPAQFDAWNINPDAFKHPMNIDEVDSVKLAEHDGMRDTIEIKRHWQGSTFTQDISLDNGSDHVVVGNSVEWHENHIFLKAAFPLAASAPTATYEIPYAAIERATTRNNSYEKAQFEVSAQRWADEGDGQHGFSLINDSKYGYDAIGNLLRLSLLRSPTSPDPEADRGHQEFRYALYPHPGNWVAAHTVEHGYNFNTGLLGSQVEAHQGDLPAEHSFASVSSPDVVLTAIKKAEDSDALIMRMYEITNKTEQVKVALPPGATGVRMTDLMEKTDGATIPVSGDTATVTIHPYEILTLKADYKH